MTGGAKMRARVAERLPAGLRERARAARFERRWGFAPPPPWSDEMGYELLLDELERHDVGQLDGDLLEIGALLGGGTAKLCHWSARNAPGKRVIAVDVFDPAWDPTTTLEGWAMSELYAQKLGERHQRDVFDEVTRRCTNLVVIAGDSTVVDVQVERLAFAFVDGSHVAEDVRTDFDTVWSRLVPGGLVAFHDYGDNLPGVTHTLHERIGAHSGEIARIWTRSPSLLFVQRERP